MRQENLRATARWQQKALSPLQTAAWVVASVWEWQLYAPSFEPATAAQFGRLRHNTSAVPVLFQHGDLFSSILNLQNVPGVMQDRKVGGHIFQ
jgi:hypothetical protein